MMVVVWEAPFSRAVTMALPFEAMAPEVAVKFAVVELAATLTDEGTVSAALFEDSEIDTGVLMEALLSVRVQELVLFEPKAAGEH